MHPGTYIISEQVFFFNGFSVCITFFYPILLFSNIYDADLSVIFDVRLITFALVFVLVSVVIVTAVIIRIEKGSAARGAMIQAILQRRQGRCREYRSECDKKSADTRRCGRCSCITLFIWLLIFRSAGVF